MTDFLTQEQVIEKLHKILRTRTQSSLAQEIGISRSFLCEIVRGTRPPTGDVLRFLGVERRIVYIEIGRRMSQPEMQK